MNEFKIELEKRIKKAIRELEKEGTNATSLPCLMQATRPPPHTLPGAPLGTNARYFYVEMFNDICKNSAFIKSFLI